MYICIVTLSVGIGDRALRPLLGIVDPLHTRYMPTNVAAYSGFDVLWYGISLMLSLATPELCALPCLLVCE